MDGILKLLRFGVKSRRKEKRDVDEGKENEGSGEQATDQQIEHRPVEETDQNRSVDQDEEGPVILDGKKFPAQKKTKTKNNRREEEDKASQIRNLRKRHRIFVSSTLSPSFSCPGPWQSFDRLGKKTENEVLLENLERFGISKPTPIQMQSIPLMMKRRHLLASAPTGSGKTFAFALPIIADLLESTIEASGVRAVILEPTRELANQTHIQLLKLTEGTEIKATLGWIESTQILISTPQRLCFALLNGQFTLNDVRWMVVDECDRLFDQVEGDERDFRSQLTQIFAACQSSTVRFAFFSATYSYMVEDWCKENLQGVVTVCIGPRNSTVDTVQQELVYTGSEQGKVLALRSLLTGNFNPPALIFVQSKDRARQLWQELQSMGLSLGIISSEINENQRRNYLHRFRSGTLWILICTELLGRGLDLPAVNLVVNFDLPTSLASYIHRIGRTGRAGRRGRAITYFAQDDIQKMRPIATAIHSAGHPVPDYLLQLKKPGKREMKRLQRQAPFRKKVAVLRRNGEKRKKKVAVLRRYGEKKKGGHKEKQ